MPRCARISSGTGIYHVMLRGINHQDIFEDRNDYWKFIKLLRQQAFPEDQEGRPLPPHCNFYAYCLMPNHVHLLVRELNEGLTIPIKSIAISYAQYFNKKYEHSGHLFQDRFKSEPVNDMEYFITLMRYIHQNPIAAGITSSVESYTWSSLCEYVEGAPCALPVCSTQSVINRISNDDLLALIREPLPKALNILDLNYELGKRLSDDKVRDYLSTILRDGNVTTLQHYQKEERNQIIQMLREYGASIRQISRITGISEGVIRRFN